MLRARRGENLDKKHLKEKYKDKSTKMAKEDEAARANSDEGIRVVGEKKSKKKNFWEM
jgi:hypothetical protein